MGARRAPRVRFRIRATWLTIWLKAGKAKPENWISTTGRSPATAMPTAAPTMPDSEMRRVEAARLSEVPLQARRGAKDAALQAHVLAEDDDGLIGAHLGAQGVGDGLQEGEDLHAFLRSSCSARMGGISWKR